MFDMVSVGADAVREALKNESALVLDTRSSHAFIGWRLEGEKFEGHIKGATDFSADWCRMKEELSYGNLETWLDEKMRFRKITSEKEIILYDMNGEDAKLVAEYLNAHGIKYLKYFYLAEWDGEYEYYPGYTTLVPPSWVKELIDGGKPEHYCGNDYRIFEISWGKPSQKFLDGHIPGTVHIDSEEFEVAPDWVRVSDEELEKWACMNGITANTTVIVYGMDNLNTSAAAKLAVVLKYMGVKQSLLINGGFGAWVRKGYPLEKGDNPKRSVESYGGTIPQDRSALVDIDECKKILKDPSKGQIIDIRDWASFIGQNSGYDYVAKAGRLPNTIWCYNFRGYMNPDRTLENREEMLATWESYGVDPNRRMAFFCGSASWGGALIEHYARAAGFMNATTYEGGWVQWLNDPENEYETGVPEYMRHQIRG